MPLPVTTCGPEKAYICRGCFEDYAPDGADFGPWCRNDVGRKACHFCGDNQGDLDLIDLAPTGPGDSNG